MYVLILFKGRENVSKWIGQKIVIGVLNVKRLYQAKTVYKENMTVIEYIQQDVSCIP